LGDLLQVLIHELGRSLPSTVTGPRGRSEEEQIDTDDETPIEPTSQLEDDRELAEVCGRKVGSLVNRMVRVLEQLVDSAETPLTTIAQLTAVLCTLRTLRQLDRQDRFRRIGVSLVPEEYRHNLFEGILETVIGGPRPIMRRTEVTALEHSMEMVHLRGLLIWLAWECKFRADRRLALGDEIDDRDDNLLQRAALLELVLPALEEPDTCSEAQRSVVATANPHQSLAASQWLQVHFEWGRNVAESAAKIMKRSTTRQGTTSAGSIVALPRSEGYSLHVVAAQSRDNVILVDLSAETHRREFLLNKVMQVAPT
jgi:hypothetical protein